MRLPSRILAIAGTLLATLLVVPWGAYAQTPAALPNKSSVPVRESSPIDGTWTISTLGKRIRFEGGRAYAVDPWTHAVFWQIQPDMVVLQNLRRLEPGAWIADDLPLAGPAQMKLATDGNIDVKVKGALFGVSYRLLRSAVDDDAWLADEMSKTDFSSDAAFAGTGGGRTAEPIEKWYVYIRRVWCTGSGVGFVKDATGYVSVNASRAGDAGRTVTTKRKKVNTDCKKKYERTRYGYKEGDAGLLVIKGTREQIKNYTINYDFEWWYGKKSTKSRTDRKRYNKPGVLQNGLGIDERKDYTWKIDGGIAPDFYLQVRFKRKQ
ncbi:MAG: hypothetical protein AAF184_25480 [Pseudomonadota bacterium]